MENQNKFNHLKRKFKCFSKHIKKTCTFWVIKFLELYLMKRNYYEAIKYFVVKYKEF